MTPAEEKALHLRRLKARIESDLERLAAVCAEGQEFASHYVDRPPDTLARRGLGAILHDFYTGLEKIFEHVAETLEGGLPSGLQWHRDLLEDMGTPIPDVRPRVLRPETVLLLDEYLRFRHLFRNIYGYELQWQRMRPLLEQLDHAWSLARTDLAAFCAFLGDLAERLE